MIDIALFPATAPSYGPGHSAQEIQCLRADKRHGLAEFDQRLQFLLLLLRQIALIVAVHQRLQMPIGLRGKAQGRNRFYHRDGSLDRHGHGNECTIILYGVTI
jgi:hypothetical protein